MFSSAVVVRAASTGPAGEQKLRLATAFAPQGAARTREVRARQSICDADEESRHEALSTQVLRPTKSRNEPWLLLRPAVSSAGHY